MPSATGRWFGVGVGGQKAAVYSWGVRDSRRMAEAAHIVQWLLWNRQYKMYLYTFDKLLNDTYDWTQKNQEYETFKCDWLGRLSAAGKLVVPDLDEIMDWSDKMVTNFAQWKSDLARPLIHGRLYVTPATHIFMMELGCANRPGFRHFPQP